MGKLSKSSGGVATWLAGLAGFALIACGGNSTNGGPNPEGVKGGEARYDASAPVDDTPPAGCGGTGSTFTDLYRDCFGRVTTGGPGCSGDGTCHGDAMHAGARGSGGFVCGADKDTCYMGLTGMVGLVQARDKGAPRMSYLISTLRHMENGVQVGSMPKRPMTFAFTESDLKRIGDWIAAGAPNN